MVNDTLGSGQHNKAKLTGRQELVHPLFHILDLNVITGRDGTALVQATIQGDDDLARTMVIDDFKVINVSVLLHDSEELDDDLGGRTDEDLALATALGISNAPKSIAQHAHTSHLNSVRGCSWQGACWWRLRKSLIHIQIDGWIKGAMEGTVFTYLFLFCW